MQVAMTQMNIIWEDRKANLKKAERLVRKAREEGAQLVIFPEMAFTGFSMNLDKTAEEPVKKAEEQEHILITPSAIKILEWSGRYDIAVVAGYAAKREDKGINCLMAAEEGQIAGYYEKIHPFSYGEEGKYFLGGSRLCRCRLRNFLFSMFICYDLRFPEIFQAVSGDCSGILVVANWPGERIQHWKVLLQARAIENQCYVLGINRTGRGGGLEYQDSSLCFDPWGKPVQGRKILLHEGRAEDSLIIVNLEEELAQECRRKFPLKSDRRTELYRQLLKEQ